jgi:hypothetical protein
MIARELAAPQLYGRPWISKRHLSFAAKHTESNWNNLKAIPLAKPFSTSVESRNKAANQQFHIVRPTDRVDCLE